MPTVVPFHRAVLSDPAFTAADGHFGVHTRWIETEFSGEIAPYDGPTADDAPPEEKTTVVVEVDGKRLEVVLPAGLGRSGRNGGARSSARRPTRRGGAGAGTSASGDALTSPMQGTIVKVVVAEGDAVEAGDPVVVLEAMKMEQPLNAHRAGIVADLSAEPGATVTSGSVLCRIVTPGGEGRIVDA
jgi:acetyl-CoA/propionyl-CoA carboxylase biotin carboxyl carrier protein